MKLFRYFTITLPKENIEMISLSREANKQRKNDIRRLRDLVSMEAASAEAEIAYEGSSGYVSSSQVNQSRVLGGTSSNKYCAEQINAKQREQQLLLKLYPVLKK
eukprot:TRINITY_DN20633_c0_g2_i2.p1 TRINITY_DN20633_c0_g2~~TRINITY_DN20633_c0_g2_i2.p1  ORF type:complete len:104 (+),score=18.54 TRINITY_DN20633_c0_g2_i2:249-560(+)